MSTAYDKVVAGGLKLKSPIRYIISCVLRQIVCSLFYRKKKATGSSGDKTLVKSLETIAGNSSSISELKIKVESKTAAEKSFEETQRRRVAFSRSYFQAFKNDHITIIHLDKRTVQKAGSQEPQRKSSRL